MWSARMTANLTIPAALLDVVPCPAFVAAVPSGRILQWNRAAAEFGGELLAGAAVTALFPAIDANGQRSLAADAVSRALQHGSSVSDLHATLSCGSTTLQVTVSVEPLNDEAGQVTSAIVVCDPAARSVDSDVRARRAEERLAIALGAARLGSWEFDVRTRRLTSSPQCKANHGFGPDEDMQFDRHIVEAVHDDYRERFAAAVAQAIDTHGAFEIEVPSRWPDGTEHWLLIAGRAVDATGMVGISQDITDRRRVEHLLRESEQQYRAIVDTANEGIWRLDQDARITFVNQRMADMLAVAPGAMLGRHKWDFVFAEDVAAMRGLFERRKQGVSEEVADIRFRRGDQGEIWTLMAARPLYDDIGSFTGAVDLFTDITQRRRAEEELRESDRRKDEFLAVLGHELRGPLSPIITAVTLLQAKGEKDPALQRLRDTILRQAMQLSRLVDDLLDVGRITAGKLRLEKHRVDLRDIARQAVEVSAALIERRRHTLRLHLPERPVYLDADAARLVQVAGNLLNNAAKYMREGGDIELLVFEESGMGVLSVRDQGVGIPPEMLDRIFDRFVQIGTSGHRADGGLGIGLSVVKALIELHGGTVEARSAGIGKGSEFAVRVPLIASAVSA
jgi:PAS domain S-box-containing protein